MTAMMIKFWAFIYRLTGWYCPLLYIYEHKYLMSRLDKIEKAYNMDEDGLSLSTFIRLSIGCWQAKNKIYRKYKWK